MSIRVERNTGWIGMGSAVTLSIDGKKVRKMRQNEVFFAAVPANGAVIQVSQFGIKSRPLAVSSGDEVEIRTMKASYYYIWLIIILPFLSVFFDSVLVRGLLIAFIIFYLALNFLKPGFHFRLDKT